MYYTGILPTLENRLHEFPTGVSDLNAFWTEFQRNISGINYISKKHISGEFAHKYYVFTHHTYQSGFLSGI